MDSTSDLFISRSPTPCTPLTFPSACLFNVSLSTFPVAFYSILFVSLLFLLISFYLCLPLSSILHTFQTMVILFGFFCVLEFPSQCYTSMHADIHLTMCILYTCSSEFNYCLIVRYTSCYTNQSFTIQVPTSLCMYTCMHVCTFEFLIHF